MHQNTTDVTESITAVANDLKEYKLSLYSNDKLTDSIFKALCLSDLPHTTDSVQYGIGAAINPCSFPSK
jgi:membrane-anchored protein YejM (alkaline phosphatase superfamily)